MYKTNKASKLSAFSLPSAVVAKLITCGLFSWERGFISPLQSVVNPTVRQSIYPLSRCGEMGRNTYMSEKKGHE